MKFIPYGKQHIDNKDVKVVSDALKKEFITTGDEVARFEKKINKFLNIPVIAAGGAGDFENMFDLLKTTNISALAAGSIYHFTKKTPLNVKKYLKKKKYLSDYEYESYKKKIY